MVDEDELDEIRERKLDQLRDQGSEEAEERQAAVEAQRKAVLRKILTEEARQRLGRLRVGYPDFAESVEDQLIMLAQSGRLQGRTIDDDTLKTILQRLRPDDRDIEITRR